MTPQHEESDGLLDSHDSWRTHPSRRSLPPRRKRPDTGRAASVEHTTDVRVKISLSFLAPLQVPGFESLTIAQRGSVDFSSAMYPGTMHGLNDYSLSFQRDTQNAWTVSGSRTLTRNARNRDSI